MWLWLWLELQTIHQFSHLVRAFSVIVKTDGLFAALVINVMGNPVSVFILGSRGPKFIYLYIKMLILSSGNMNFEY